MEIDLTLIVSVTAVVISLIALVRTRKKDEREEMYRLLELKTEVRLSANKLQNLFGELSLIFLQQLSIGKDLKNPTDEQIGNMERVKSNIMLIKEKRDNAHSSMLKLTEITPDTFEHWQDMKVTFESWIKDIETELSNELYAIEFMNRKPTRSRSSFSAV